ncbi:Alpha-mannosidase 2x [Hypsibius exemplaris]|uniref:Alpha-mannosidase n=1 Tax=Hypsibius exemplaris TaxID=2072580 RepID=A0A1W0X1Z2_HYPEX|nr:Alpha-mannosidase 2x [Hypsibius exemplaris]
MRRYGRFFSLKQMLRKVPVPVLIIGIIVVILCPIALLHFSSNNQGGNTLLNDIPVLRKNEKERKNYHENKSWLRNPFLQQPAGGGFRSPELLDGVPVEWSQQELSRPVVCPSVARLASKPSFDLANLTFTLTDLSSDGDLGIWDEEMDAAYHKTPKIKSTSDTGKKPLLVYVVPFSHADPGWLSTVEEYFSTSTKLALDNMLKRLLEWPDMTFIWAETSYFKMWWETLDAGKRKAVLDLTKSGRLEIVNGGYVMPDEASCSAYAILHQYIYGHQWLLDNLGVTPEHGFSIDPFGHSSSMPYFLRNLDFKTIFIQRIHYNIRRHLGKHKATEFLWEQRWDSTASTSIFTHLAPHHLYTIKNICGLTKNNCYFYDFKDIMFEIEKSQMETQAQILLEEMRKTVSLYPHNVLLYILGDDFRWAEDTEWTNQYKNYKLLMKLINSNPANDVIMQFGTLKNYYDAVFERSGTPDAPTPSLPSVQGDFFPYADKYEDYWTGYFTSRPFYKQMSRELERDLRTAEILLVLAKLESFGNDGADFQEDLIGLERAAESLGLFQHHDAITGTSKQMVALDYGDKLQNGLLMAHAVILKNVQRQADAERVDIILESYRPTPGSLPAKSPLFFKPGNMERIVFLFNPLARSRTTVIHLLSETQNLRITDADGREIAYQVSPALNDVDTQGSYLDVLRITFFLQLDPLALKAISIKSLGERTKKIKIKTRSTTTIRSTDRAGDKVKIQGFSVKELDPAELVTLTNAYMAATFRPEDGMLQALRTRKGKRKVAMELKRYESMNSGAYLFRPTGLGDLKPYPYTVRVLQGPLFSEIQTHTGGVVLIVRIYNSATDLDKSLEVELITQMEKLGENNELVLRLTTDIRNNLTFHTDSNGFQIIQRRVSHVLPMAANYYPATSMGFMEDDRSRLTLHLTQAHGVGSQRNGEIEVMIDRFLMQDDGRGVGEALRDPRVVKTHLQLQLETEGFCLDCPLKNPTDTAHRVNLAANNPPHITFEQEMSNLTTFNYEPVQSNLPCDVHLLMMKPVTYNPGDKRVGFLFHRPGLDCSTPRTSDLDVCLPGTEDILLGGLLKKAHTFKSYNETTFNFVNSRKRFGIKTPIRLLPMHIGAYTVNLP